MDRSRRADPGVVVGGGVDHLRVTPTQARRFLLARHGLLGPRRFEGEEGVVELIGQLGCLQFDPVNVCGRAPELSLAARVEGYEPDLLHGALYRDRRLFDYYDKEMSIIPLADWPSFRRLRSRFREAGRSREVTDVHAPAVLERIAAEGPLCSDDLALAGKVDWFWAESKASRVVLESLYLRGDLVVHHKTGARKYYDLAERHVPAALLAAPDPRPDDQDHLDWHTLRRVRSVGLLWARPSSAWQGTAPDLRLMPSAAERAASLARLTGCGVLVRVQVDGVRLPLYCAEADRALLDASAEADPGDRLEFLGPLDNLLWDRALVLAVFGFDYTWEIYTPAAKRRFAAYVLPIVERDALVGRLAAHRSGRALVVDRIWYEAGWRRTAGHARRLRRALHELARLNGCATVSPPR